MLERISINLSTEERVALEEIASSEMRDIRDQIRFLIRQELEKRSLLISDPKLSSSINAVEKDIKHE